MALADGEASFMSFAATPMKGGGESQQPNRKTTFVCGLCGKDNASEAPFLKHLERHVNGRQWIPGVDDSRVLRSRCPPCPTANEETPSAAESSSENNGEAAAKGEEKVKGETFSMARWLSDRAVVRAETARAAKEAVDKRMAQLEDSIGSAWQLLQEPARVFSDSVEEETKEGGDGSVNGLVGGKPLLSLLSGVVYGAHEWQRLQGSGDAIEAFFEDICAPLAQCTRRRAGGRRRRAAPRARARGTRRP